MCFHEHHVDLCLLRFIFKLQDYKALIVTLGTPEGIPATGSTTLVPIATTNDIEADGALKPISAVNTDVAPQLRQPTEFENVVEEWVEAEIGDSSFVYIDVSLGKDKVLVGMRQQVRQYHRRCTV